MSTEANSSEHEISSAKRSKPPQISIHTDYQDILRGELKRRKDANPLFSIRAFARWLGMGKTTVSDVIAGRRNLSTRSALKVNEKLKIEESRARDLLRDLKQKRKRNRLH